METLNSLLVDTTGMNKLCLFSVDPDTSSEGGSVDSIVSIDGHPVLVITIDLKWQESEQPIEFCRSFAANTYGWCVIGEGEAYQYETLSVNGELFSEDVDDEVWEAILERHVLQSRGRTSASLPTVAPLAPNAAELPVGRRSMRILRTCSMARLFPKLPERSLWRALGLLALMATFGNRDSLVGEAGPESAPSR